MKNKEETAVLRAHAEVAYAKELAALQKADKHERPTNWLLSPKAVVDYLMGGVTVGKTEISPKYFGSRRLIEVAVATLVTDRALLLVGIPGTAKTWVSEHLAAAISGDSTLLVQGTAGMGEESIRYGWNYARLLSEGPSHRALVPSPILRAMKDGKIARLEELTRIPSEIQDNLITLLSEKLLPIPELETEVQAIEGFNLIATANDRDRGVNELSSALQRRFNTVVMPLPPSLEEEVKIVKARVDKKNWASRAASNKELKEIQRLVTIFRELRSGSSEDGRAKINSPSGTLSPAEAISVVNSGLALSRHFGTGELKAKDLAAGLQGAIIKDPVQDKTIWQEYLETIVKERKGWSDLYKACKETL
ncbi:MAG: AAA family ATPase [Saprospiraceae bacterium]|nr:AAA family ATPase [Saprospiraceae bacterium]